MVHFESGKMINLTDKPITVYTSSGGFITLYPQTEVPQDYSGLFFIIEDFQHSIMLELGIKDCQLLKASPKQKGRNGVEVQMLWTYSKKSIRIMPAGEF